MPRGRYTDFLPVFFRPAAAAPLPRVDGREISAVESRRVMWGSPGCACVQGVAAARASLSQ